MIDLVASSIVGLAVVAGSVAWALRGKRARADERVARAGSSVLLGQGAQQAACFAAGPLGRGLARAGVPASAITLASIPLAFAASVALVEEHYGVAALLAALCYACDALDGMVARASGTASDTGEVLDAVCDRICEGLLLGGLAVAWRGSPPLLVLALLAAFGAQQVTLATAKAEVFPAAGAAVPRGVMRRSERAVYLVGAAAVAGVLLDVLPATVAPVAARVPMAVGAALVAVFGNTSALHRFACLGRALQRPARREVPRAAE